MLIQWSACWTCCQEVWVWVSAWALKDHYVTSSRNPFISLGQNYAMPFQASQPPWYQHHCRLKSSFISKVIFPIAYIVKKFYDIARVENRWEELVRSCKGEVLVKQTATLKRAVTPLAHSCSKCLQIKTCSEHHACECRVLLKEKPILKFSLPLSSVKFCTDKQF